MISKLIDSSKFFFEVSEFPRNGHFRGIGHFQSLASDFSDSENFRQNKILVKFRSRIRDNPSDIRDEGYTT